MTLLLFAGAPHAKEHPWVLTARNLLTSTSLRGPTPAAAPVPWWARSPVPSAQLQPRTEAGEESGKFAAARTEDSCGLWQRREQAARKDGSLNHSTGCDWLRCSCSTSQGGLLFALELPCHHIPTARAPQPAAPPGQVSPSIHPGPLRQPQGIPGKAGVSPPLRIWFLQAGRAIGQGRRREAASPGEQRQSPATSAQAHSPGQPPLRVRTMGIRKSFAQPSSPLKRAKPTNCPCVSGLELGRGRQLGSNGAQHQLCHPHQQPLTPKLLSLGNGSWQRAKGWEWEEI